MDVRLNTLEGTVEAVMERCKLNFEEVPPALRFSFDDPVYDEKKQVYWINAYNPQGVNTVRVKIERPGYFQVLRVNNCERVTEVNLVDGTYQFLDYSGED